MTKAAVAIGLVLLLLVLSRGFIKHSLFHFLEHLYEHHPDGFIATLGSLLWVMALTAFGGIVYCVYVLFDSL